MNATKQEVVQDLFLWEKMNFESIFFISQDFIYYTGYKAGAYPIYSLVAYLVVGYQRSWKGLPERSAVNTPPDSLLEMTNNNFITQFSTKLISPRSKNPT
jgi:hypothetical protein